MKDRKNFDRKKYEETLKFILIKATNDIFPRAEVVIAHSLSKGLFGEIYKGTPLTLEDIDLIKNRMSEIIHEDRPIKKVTMPIKKLEKLGCINNRPDMMRFIEYVDKEFLDLYELDHFYDYFQTDLFQSTGQVNLFDLVLYEGGFILLYPEDNAPYRLPLFVENKKLAKIFHEAETWGKILEVNDVGALNKLIRENKIADMIRVNEALHEKKIAIIADEIHQRKEVKLITIAGPSSSGKTTFTKRLAIQLRVNGFNPTIVSVDNYYKGRDLVPLDEDGEKDFESIYALDLELFNAHIEMLVSGKEIEVPTYNFHTGMRDKKVTKVRLPENGILLIEGIHGLNELLTKSVSREHKFKIYISCLTQLSIDDHNRIPTSDVRKIRRIVRDSLFRGAPAEITLKMWPSIRRGEEKNIFVFQEEADAMFNSNLSYELGVLKKCALKELEKVKIESKNYDEAQRIITFLEHFQEIDTDLVPDISILREFIGESYFYKY